jgi:hypothetical protein
MPSDTQLPKAVCTLTPAREVISTGASFVPVPRGRRRSCAARGPRLRLPPVCPCQVFCSVQVDSERSPRWTPLARLRHKGGSPSPPAPYPGPAAHLKRGESLMHSSNSTVMAAASGAHCAEDQGASSGIPGPWTVCGARAELRSAPARPPARLGLSPARRGPAPPVTAGERRQSQPLPAPPAVTSGERR